MTLSDSTYRNCAKSLSALDKIVSQLLRKLDETVLIAGLFMRYPVDIILSSVIFYYDSAYDVCILVIFIKSVQSCCCSFVENHSIKSNIKIPKKNIKIIKAIIRCSFIFGFSDTVCILTVFKHVLVYNYTSQISHH